MAAKIKIKKVKRKGKTFFRFELEGGNGETLNDLYVDEDNAISAARELKGQIAEAEIVNVNGEPVDDEVSR